MQPTTVLVVDDEELVRWSLARRLESAGHNVLLAADGAEAMAQLAGGVDLVLLDYKLPDTDGLALLPRLKALDPDVVVVLMTGFSKVENAVDAMRLGAFHYLPKPFNFDDIMATVVRALETTRLRREVKALRRSRAAGGLGSLVGESPAMQEVRSLLTKVAASPATTVLLTGETGTGKDLAAKVLHAISDRGAEPFMNITCSAVPDHLLESELFGHERGAFTDARDRKPGLLSLADGGTVFLDEIGEMSPMLQAKLLRFLEEKAFKRVGGGVDVKVDVRIIAATHRDLEAEVEAGTFRSDLFFRLNVLPIRLPPLRERTGDLPLLVDCFLDRFGQEFHKTVSGIEPEALRVLEAWRWPGNVRELKNAIERAVLLAEGPVIRRGDFRGPFGEPVPVGPVFRLPPEGVDLVALERDLVVQALARVNGNRTRAAALLGLNRDQIRYRIEKFEL